MAGAVPSLAGNVEVTILDGGRQQPGGVKGATVVLEGTAHSVSTDIKGKATISSVTSGRYVVRVTGPDGFTPVRLSVAVGPSGTVAVQPVLLPRVPTGAAVTVPTSGGVVSATTQVESTLVPGARLTVSSGTTISGLPAQNPALAIFPVDRALTPVPFPGELEPVRLYAISKGGLGFSPGQALRLPNDEALAPGVKRPVYALLPRPDLEGSDWRLVGTATVDGGGTFLASDTAFVQSATYFAVHASSAALKTRYRLLLQDAGGNPLSGATVLVEGVPVLETSTPGTYEGDDVAHPGAPVKAMVSKEFGSGLVLRALTEPVHVVDALTLLHRGQPLTLALSAEGEAVAAAVVRNTTTSHGSYLATELVMSPVATDGDGLAGATHTAFFGPENLTFAGSAAPLTSFSHSPSGTLTAPDTAPVLSFTVLAMDPAFDPDGQDPYTTTARVTSAVFSVDGGSTWNAAALLPRSDGAGPFAVPPLEGGRRAFLWDLWSLPAPAGIDGTSQEVRLRAIVEDAPSGNSRTAEASFRYQWPHADVARISPQHEATGVWTDTQVVVDFVHPMNATTITTSNLTVTEVGVGQVTSVSVSYNATSRQATLTFTGGDLPTLKSYTVSVGTGVENAYGVNGAATVSATFTTGTLPALEDQDGDGLLNEEEAALGTDPADPDEDGDGLSDYQELYVTFTNPKITDTDQDGTPDGSDASPRGNPSDSPLVPDVAVTGTFVVTQITPTGTFGAPANVPADVVIQVTFSDPFDVATVTSSNFTLQDQTTLLNVNLALLPSPNPRTLVAAPTVALVTSRVYLITVEDSSAIEDIDGNPVQGLADSVFRVSAPAADLFEATHYHQTLAITDWEQFPLTAATANGRAGNAVVVPSTRKLYLVETDLVTPGRGVPVEASVPLGPLGGCRSGRDGSGSP